MRTTDPITIDNCAPEFVRISNAVRMFGIGRTLLLAYIKSGDIKSVFLRKRGAKAGLRLVSVDSARAFLAQELDASGGIDVQRSAEATRLRARRSKKGNAR